MIGKKRTRRERVLQRQSDPVLLEYTYYKKAITTETLTRGMSALLGGFPVGPEIRQ